MSQSDTCQPRRDPALPGVPPIVRELRSTIERSLRTRHCGHGEILFHVEDRAKTAGATVWAQLKHRPYAGVVAASVAGFTLASIAGVGELAFAALCAYGAYEILRRDQPIGQTVEEMVRDVAKMT
jgi:hypothetical protein